MPRRNPLPDDASFEAYGTPITADEIRSGLSWFRAARSGLTDTIVPIDSEVTRVIGNVDARALSDDTLSTVAETVTDRVESMTDSRLGWDWDDVPDDPRDGTHVTATLTESRAHSLIGMVRMRLVNSDDPAVPAVPGTKLDNTAYVLTYAALRATTGQVHGTHHMEAVVHRSEERQETTRRRQGRLSEEELVQMHNEREEKLINDAESGEIGESGLDELLSRYVTMDELTDIVDMDAEEIRAVISDPVDDGGGDE